MKKSIKLPDSTPEERALYIELAKKFGLKIARTIDAIPGEVKIIKIESFCFLCETTTAKYIRMLKYTDNTWKHDIAVSEEEAGEVSELNIHRNNVGCCPNCKSFLMAKDKIELVNMITRYSSDALINLGVKKALEDMRKENKNDNLKKNVDKMEKGSSSS